MCIPSLTNAHFGGILPAGTRERNHSSGLSSKDHSPSQATSFLFCSFPIFLKRGIAMSNAHQESLVLKKRAFLPIGSQAEFWKKQGYKNPTIDTETIQRMAQCYMGLQSTETAHPFLPCVLPKDFFNVRHNNFINAIKELFLEQNVDIYGEELPQDEKCSWHERFQDACSSQKGDLVVFLQQFWHGCPYSNQRVWVSLKPNESFTPLRAILLMLCAQPVRSFWSNSKGSWIGSAEDEIPRRNKKGMTTCLCLKYRGIDFSDPREIETIKVEIIPISRLFYYNPEEKGFGGFASTLFF